MSVNTNCAPPQGTLIADQGEATLNKDSFSPSSEKPESDIFADLQPDPDVKLLMDSSALLCICRHHFDHLMSLLAKLPEDKAFSFYQNAAQIFGAFQRSCLHEAKKIEQQ